MHIFRLKIKLNLNIFLRGRRLYEMVVFKGGSFQFCDVWVVAKRVEQCGVVFVTDPGEFI